MSKYRTWLWSLRYFWIPLALCAAVALLKIAAEYTSSCIFSVLDRSLCFGSYDLGNIMMHTWLLSLLVAPLCLLLMLVVGAVRAIRLARSKQA